jgi:ABC-2 type transport system permease protein
LGVPPSGEEVARSLLVSGGLHLLRRHLAGGGMVFSVVFRQPASAALAAIAVWLFFTVFWGILAGLLAQSLAPVSMASPRRSCARLSWSWPWRAFRPNTLYGEAMLALLQPTIRSVGCCCPSNCKGRCSGRRCH